MSTDSTQISEREREILRLVAMGATNQQIAHQLNISINTVKVHLRNIFSKINVASRTEATVYAIQQGLVQLDTPSVSPAEIEAEPDAPADLAEAITPLEQALPTTPNDESVAEPSALAAPIEPEPAPEPALIVPPSAVEPVPSSESVPAMSEASTPAASEQPKPIATSNTSPTRSLPWFWLVLGVIVLLLAVAVGSYQLAARNTPPPSPTAAQPSQPINNTWIIHGTTPKAQTDFATVTYDGRLYMIGGQIGETASKALERYDPSSNTWVLLADKPTAVSQIQATVVRGNIYVPGGQDSGGQVLDILEMYDPTTQQWQQLPPMPEPRSNYALVSAEGRFYVIGGWDGTSYRNDVFMYDPDSATWSSRAAMPTARRNAGVAVIEGRIYVIGGENDQGGLRTNERYDPNVGSDGQWQPQAPLPVAIAHPALANINSNILVFDGASNKAYQYDSLTDAWAELALPDNLPPTQHISAFNNSSIFLFSQPQEGQALQLTEYRLVNRLFLPNIGAQ